jgi:hypothetical protein
MRSIVASFDPEKELRERAASVQARSSIANRVALACLHRAGLVLGRERGYDSLVKSCERDWR